MDNVEFKIIQRLSAKYGIPERIVKEIVHSQFEFASKEIKKHDFNSKSDEEIKNQKTNFRFRFLGTLYIPERLLKNRKNIKKNGDKS